MGLTREQILAKNDVETRDVDVPEWGDGATIRVRGLSTAARFQWFALSKKALAGEPGPDPTSLAVTLGAVDDDGAQLFQLQDVDALGSMAGSVIDRIAEAVLELSGLSGTAVEDAEGNSDATPSGGTDTESPATSE